MRWKIGFKISYPQPYFLDHKAIKSQSKRKSSDFFSLMLLFHFMKKMTRSKVIYKIKVRPWAKNILKDNILYEISQHDKTDNFQTYKFNFFDLVKERT